MSLSNSHCLSVPNTASVVGQYLSLSDTASVVGQYLSVPNIASVVGQCLCPCLTLLLSWDSVTENLNTPFAQQEQYVKIQFQVKMLRMLP